MGNCNHIEKQTVLMLQPVPGYLTPAFKTEILCGTCGKRLIGIVGEQPELKKV